MALVRRSVIAAGILFVLQYVGYALYVVFKGVPSPVSLALGIARTPDAAHLFVLGLVAGSLSFGGAYTAIPFVQAEAVLLGGWLPQQVFIDCIAVSRLFGETLPSPFGSSHTLDPQTDREYSPCSFSNLCYLRRLSGWLCS